MEETYEKEQRGTEQCLSIKQSWRSQTYQTNKEIRILRQFALQIYEIQGTEELFLTKKRLSRQEKQNSKLQREILLNLNSLRQKKATLRKLLITHQSSPFVLVVKMEILLSCYEKVEGYVDTYSHYVLGADGRDLHFYDFFTFVAKVFSRKLFRYCNSKTRKFENSWSINIKH